MNRKLGNVFGFSRIKCNMTIFLCHLVILIQQSEKHLWYTGLCTQTIYMVRNFRSSVVDLTSGINYVENLTDNTMCLFPHGRFVNYRMN